MATTSKKGGLLGVLERAKADKKLSIDRDTFRTGDEIVETISTGSIIVDKLLGRGNSIGGIGKGRLTEIFGLESSGKTTLALHIAKEIQNRGGNVAFFDFEQALDIDYAEKAIGINIAEERFSWLTPKNLEEGCNLAEYLVDNYSDSKIDLIIMDSVKAMQPRAVIEGLIGDEPPMALQARKIGQFVGKMTKKISKTNTILILLNQMTKNIKSNPYQSGGEFETPGGLSIRFYASSRILLKQTSKETTEQLNPITNAQEEMPSASKVRANIIKNKIGTPYRSAEFYIKYGSGIDNKRSVLDMAIAHNVIKQAGSWFSYKEDSGGFRFQGEETMREFLLAPENKGTLKEILDQIILKQDEKVKEEAKHFEEEEKIVERKLANKLRGSKLLKEEKEAKTESEELLKEKEATAE